GYRIYALGTSSQAYLTIMDVGESLKSNKKKRDPCLMGPSLSLFIVRISIVRHSLYTCYIHRYLLYGHFCKPDMCPLLPNRLIHLCFPVLEWYPSIQHVVYRLGSQQAFHQLLCFPRTSR